MSSADDLAQERDWQILHDRITEILDQHGLKNALGDGDYWLLDENWGWTVQQLEFQNLNLLTPHTIRLLQETLSGYPTWSITIRIDVVGKEKEWPGMGLIIYPDEIVDELQRDFLPLEYANMVFASAPQPQFKILVMNGTTGKESKYVWNDAITYNDVAQFLERLSGRQPTASSSDPNRTKFYCLMTHEQIEAFDRFLASLTLNSPRHR
jgi:hypothetical protein